MSNTPNIRFKDFTNPWKQRKLEDILTEYYEKCEKDGTYEHVSLTTEGVVPKSERYERDQLVRHDDKKYRVTHFDDICYNPANLKFGVICRNKYKDGIFSPIYITFKVNEGYFPAFIEMVVTRSEFIQDALQYQQGTVYERMAVNPEDLLSLNIFVPNILEQEKIAASLTNLDNIITLQQRKCDEVSELKKFMLQKMFPQNGEQFPEIRFSGFVDPWEQRKLGEIGSIQTCKSIFKEQTSESGEIPFYKNGTIGLKADAYISRELFEEYKNLYPYPEIGDILISAVGSIGRTAEYMGEDEYFQDSNVVWLKTGNHIDKKFLKVSYQVINWLIEGSTVKHLYNDNILKSEIYMPNSQEEQKEIGTYFDILDQLITLHQRKCDVLKDIKKYMMHNMFPQKG